MSNSHDSEKKQPKYHSKRWIGCSVEEEFFGEQRKDSKKKRKQAAATDRSKYKKTDLEKWQKSRDANTAERISRTDLSKGKVFAIVPEGIKVRDEQEGEILCILRGALKKERSQLKNLVVVGDIVQFERLAPHQGAIVQVEPRKSVLSRADNLSRRKEHLIAANVDQVLITGSVVKPALKPGLLDRYVIAAQRGGMKPIIVINKIDMLEAEGVDPDLQQSEKDLFEHLLQAYKDAGIEVIPLSAVTGAGMDLLRTTMENKSSVFSGQSGVGKSSLINAVTGAELRVGPIVDSTNKGSHTTTSTSLIPLSFGGWCVDTPGIRSFGVWDLKKDEIQGYFSEIHALGRQCHFPNCSHFHEEHCAVREAVEKGEISLIRFCSYQSLMIGADEEHQRR